MNDPFGGQIHWRTLAALKSNKRWAEHLMSGIIGVARLTIQEGKAEEFKRMAQRVMELVRTRDTGVIGYDIYLSDDESAAVVVEHYADSQTFGAHMAHMSEGLMGELMGIVSITGEILGDLDSELRAGMEGGPFSFYAPLLSLSE